MKRFVTVWPLLALVLASCVTINIYFPAAAAEEAARTIVRDVLGKEGKPAESPKPDEKPQSSLDLEGLGRNLAMGLLDALLPAAQAAGQANIDISSPAIKRLRASMAARQHALAPFYQAGVVGFDRQGLVAIRDLSAASLRDRARVKKLVAAENRDRNALYREIARANGHPEWEEEIRATFAKVWVEEAAPGYWYQDADGRWRRK
ncbi:MAG: DUF1318 domain-containing protein [Gammaproteobacteria bacterium]|nr:MAG: DUF1318 domain-containing protein [Gammaproteobacteria bacterium]